MGKDWTGNGKSIFTTLGASNHTEKEREAYSLPKRRCHGRNDASKDSGALSAKSFSAIKFAISMTPGSFIS